MNRFYTYLIAILLFVPAFASSDDLSSDDNFLTLEILPTIDVHRIPVQISLSNKQEITACEFCLSLPNEKNLLVQNSEGAGYEYETSSRMTDSHSVAMKWGAKDYPNMMFVSIASATTASFEGNAGPLITFYIDGSGLEEGKYEIELQNSMLISSTTYNTSSTITPDKNDYFTLDNSKVYPGVEPKSCMVTFKLDSEVLVSEKYPIGVLPIAPSVESKTGYTFSGWGALNTTNADITYNASLIPNKYIIIYNVGDEVYRKDTLDYNTPIVPPEAPAKTGYTFTGWGDVAAVVTEDATYEAQFIINRYIVRFEVDGEVYSKDTLDYNTPIVPPEAPAKTGYTFTGWGDVASTITSDLTYTATFTPNQYAVVFIAEGDTIQNQLLDFGTTITAPVAPFVEGFTFKDWGTEVGTVLAKDITFFAVYIPNSYEVIYYADGDVFEQDTYEYGEDIVPPTEIPVKDGFKFVGWGEMEATMPAHNLEYTAIFMRLGDVNLDDMVNAADVVSIYNYIISGDDSGIIKENADVNNDGVVNAADIVNVYNFIIYGDDNK